MQLNLRSVKLLVIAVLALLGACAPPLPPTDRPVDAKAALALLGADGVEVFLVAPDPACSYTREDGAEVRGFWNADGCRGGLQEGRQVWLVDPPAWSRFFSAGSLPHEVCGHLRHGDDDHKGPWFAPGGEVDDCRALLRAHPAADAIEVR
jgi:hypothetical protein